MNCANANLHSKIERGGDSEASCKDEEPIAQHPVRTQAYWKYVEESAEETTKLYQRRRIGMRISATSRTLTLPSAFSSFIPSSNIVRQ